MSFVTIHSSLTSQAIQLKAKNSGKEVTDEQAASSGESCWKVMAFPFPGAA